MSKGSIFDILVIGILMFVLAVGIVISSVVMTKIQTTTADLLPAVAADALQQGTNAIKTFNYGFVIIVIGLGIGSVIFAYLVPTNPIFIIVSIIMLMIFMIVLPVLSNAFETFTSDTQMATAMVNFPLMSMMMGNMPLIGLIFGVLVIIVLYTRYQSSGNA